MNLNRTKTPELYQPITTSQSRTQSGFTRNRKLSVIVRKSSLAQIQTIEHINSTNPNNTNTPNNLNFQINGEPITKEEIQNITTQRQKSICGLQRTSVSRKQTTLIEQNESRNSIYSTNEIRKSLQRLSEGKQDCVEITFRGHKIRVSEKSKHIFNVSKTLQTQTETEENYNKQLAFLVEKYVIPLKDKSKQKELNLKEEDFKTMFCGIEEIYNVSNEFSKQFKKYNELNEDEINNSDETNVYKQKEMFKGIEEQRFENFCIWFLSACDLLKVYKRYMYNHPFALKTYNKIMNVEKNSKFVQFMKQKNEEKPRDCTNLVWNLRSLIELPQNHLPKYIVKFKEVFSIIPVNNSKKELAEQLIVKVTDLLDEINDYITAQEQIDDLKKLTDKISGLDEVTSFFKKQSLNELTQTLNERELEKNERILIDEIEVGFWVLKDSDNYYTSNDINDLNDTEEMNLVCESGRLLLFTDCILLCSDQGFFQKLWKWEWKMNWKYEDLMLFDNVILGNEVDAIVEITQSADYLSEKVFDKVTSHFFDSLIFIDKKQCQLRNQSNIMNATHNFFYIWPINSGNVREFKKSITSHFKKYMTFEKKEF